MPEIVSDIKFVGFLCKNLILGVCSDVSGYQQYNGNECRETI
jgi:hypothetical protein